MKKFLRHLRPHPQGRRARTVSHDRDDPHAAMPAHDCTQRLPPPLLSAIFADVCPHVRDDSYNSSEESMTEDGCMLCDMRDLAHCALVCRRWHREAQALLYRHVRIDPVHYCELEIALADKRKKNRSMFDRNGEPIDAPQVRLTLFMRTVRERRDLAALVLSLRMPYMTREASKAVLARTVSVLPGLRYVDLPAGFYADEPSSLALKQELMARCPEIRRMRYAAGAEATFAAVPGSRLWANLEVLELSSLDVEPTTLRRVLSAFPLLQDLTLEHLPWADDSLFAPVSAVPPFPPLQRLSLLDVPNITASGLATYLSNPQTRGVLAHLTLSNTGVLPHTLHAILLAAPGLRSLSISQEVSRAFPLEHIPPLSSRSLRMLHYEITSPGSSYGLQPTASTYYAYLMSSLTSNALPALQDLYVRDATFPETLLLAPPPRIFSGGDPQPRHRGLNRPLNVYSKGMDELEWNFTPYEPPATRGRRDSTTRPVSFHGAQLSPSWGGEARRSVLVGNGFGGFLAVPVDEGRPKSSGGWKSEGKQDLWR
ncbi:hypothetical protein VTN02DRAFT_5623 [Thermoascus thermophilus]